jgi:hypothetical protein
MPPHVKMSIKHDMRELFLKQTNCHTIGTVTKSIIKITEKCKTVTPATQKQDHLLSWLGTGKCFQHVSKMPTLTYNPANSVIYKERYNLEHCS